MTWRPSERGYAHRPGDGFAWVDSDEDREKYPGERGAYLKVTPEGIEVGTWYDTYAIGPSTFIPWTMLDELRGQK